MNAADDEPIPDDAPPAPALENAEALARALRAARDKLGGLRQFPCESCGAPMRFKPGTRRLKCPYCGHENDIPQLEDIPTDAQAADPASAPSPEGAGADADANTGAGAVKELDYEAFLALADAHEDKEGVEVEADVVHCRGCGADITLPPDVAADLCPYCTQPVVAADAVKQRIRVQALLPFKITRAQAEESWRAWLSGLWFAPSSLKRDARKKGAFVGVYIPYWTYDSRTRSYYVGQRGDYYYVTVSYTVMVNGRAQRRTRQERRTRWTPASGTVERDFDDVLIPASRVWPTDMLNQLEPWDLPRLEAYRPEFLSGFRAEKFQLGLKDGFAIARGRMDEVIRGDVKRDIGGDVQRVERVDTDHRDVTFKHLLLPLWTNGYRFGQRVYHFYINARTGEVIGERPWSAWKITLASLAGAGLVAGLLWWLGVFN